MTLARVLVFIFVLALVPALSAADAETNSTDDSPKTGRIGNTGYVVPIPEIKIRSIVGETKPPEDRNDKSESQPSPHVQDSQPLKPQMVGPRKQAPAKPIEPSQPAVQEKTEAGDQREAGSPHPVRTGIHKEEFKSESEPPKEPKAKKESEDRAELPWRPPIAPELMGDPPVPPKEIFKKKAVSIPTILESKASPKAGTPKIEKDSFRELQVTPEQLPVASRNEPERSPDPVVSNETVQTKSHTNVASQPEIARPEMSEPSPEPGFRPMQAPTEPPTEKMVDKQPAQSDDDDKQQEPIISSNPPEPEPKPDKVPETATRHASLIPTPLDLDARTSRAARDYLRETAPILEELSILMTRVPVLPIADYDPSDQNAALFPKEAYLKLDAIKRELQILDSKTFSIIPPAKYTVFHGLIRESITATYQACDSIISFFNERTPSNYQTIMDHLQKARDLIKQTRTAGPAVASIH